jgi:hypothetical protein
VAEHNFQGDVQVNSGEVEAPVASTDAAAPCEPCHNALRERSKEPLPQHVVHNKASAAAKASTVPPAEWVPEEGDVEGNNGGAEAARDVLAAKHKKVRAIAQAMHEKTLANKVTGI